MGTFAPIILFVYNRPEHTKKVVEALLRNSIANQSDLFVFADGPKENATIEDIDKLVSVRQYIKTISGFKSVTIIEQTKNKGLDPSEIDGVTQVINQFNRVIVLEDDTIVLPLFLQFMNEALEFYKFNPKVFSIGSFSPKIDYLNRIKSSVYSSYRCASFGWATWKDRWDKCIWDKEYILNSRLIKHPTIYNKLKYNRAGGDMYDNLVAYANGNNDAWDARWQYCLYENNGVCIRPTKSLTYNIGFDGTGEHCGDLDVEKFGLMPILDLSTIYNI